jgi:hypothetical protein
MMSSTISTSRPAIGASNAGAARQVERALPGIGQREHGGHEPAGDATSEAGAGQPPRDELAAGRFGQLEHAPDVEGRIGIPRIEQRRHDPVPDRVAQERVGIRVGRVVGPHESARAAHVLDLVACKAEQRADELDPGREAPADGHRVDVAAAARHADEREQRLLGLVAGGVPGAHDVAAELVRVLDGCAIPRLARSILDARAVGKLDFHGAVDEWRVDVRGGCGGGIAFGRSIRPEAVVDVEHVDRAGSGAAGQLGEQRDERDGVRAAGTEREHAPADERT